MAANGHTDEDELVNLMADDPDVSLDTDDLLRNEEHLVKKYPGGDWEPSNWLGKAWGFTKTVTKRVLGINPDPEAYEARRPSPEEGDVLDDTKTTGEESENWLSCLWFGWFTSTVDTGRQQPLYLRDLGKVQSFLTPPVVSEHFEQVWAKESADPATHAPSFFWAIVKAYWWEYCKIGIPRTFRITTGFLQPFLVKKFLSILEDPGNSNYWMALLFLTLLTLAVVANELSFQHYCQFNLKTEITVKPAIQNLLYKKTLKLSANAKQSNVHGRLMNLIGGDVGRIVAMFRQGQFFWLTPAMTIACFCTVYTLMGALPALAGFALLFIIVPISTLIAKRYQVVRKTTTELTDARVKTVEEIFHTMKTVKVYALEEHFAKAADEARARELSQIRLTQLWKALHACINDSTIPLMSLVTFLTYILRGGILTPSTAFSVITTYFALHWPFLMITTAISSAVECQVSIARIQEYLELPEVPGLAQSEDVQPGEIILEDATYSWDFESTLKNINLKFEPGTLACIVGPVGAGKSSLLSLLLGELKRTGGTTKMRGKLAYVPQIPFLIHGTLRDNVLFGEPFDEERYNTVIEKCALKPDLDMLVAGDLTIIGERGINLSGGQKARVAMARAVYAKSDIVLLDDPLSAVDAHVGHKLFHECIKTLLKDKTVLLVTHQLQFVTLGDKLVVMQDGTIQHFGAPAQLREQGVDLASLLEKFNEQLNKKQEREPVEAEEQEEIDYDAMEEADGSSHHSGSLRASQASLTRSGQLKRSLGAPIGSTSLLDDGKTHAASAATAEQLAAAASAINQTQAEERGKGAIGLSVYKFYFSHKRFWWIFAISMIFAHQCLNLFILSYLGRWSASNTPAEAPVAETPAPVDPTTAPDASPDHIVTTAMSSVLDMVQSIGSSALSVINSDPSTPTAAPTGLPPSTVKFLIVYVVCDIFLIATDMLSSALFLLVSCWTGRVVYMEMFQRLIRAPMSFFDTTPKGRIAARCSNDTDVMDTRIADPLAETAYAAGSIVTSMFLIFMSIGWWVFGILPVCLIYYALYNRMINTFRDLIRVEGNTKSPINTQFSESLNGVFTLRAFGREADFTKQLHHKLEVWGRAYYYKETCERWLGIRMDGVGIVMMAVVGVIGIFSKGINPGMMAVAMILMLDNTDMFTNFIESGTRLEGYMNSVERIEQYTKVPQERPFRTNHVPPEAWPKEGGINFDNVSFRYRDGLPLVLDGLTFKIKPGEKVGVVGRTGAGKSSLLTTLLSLAPLAGGRITIDGVDVNQIGVSDLRSRLSIIPQDPVIFGGTIRHNIDPFDTHSDDDIWATLRRVHLSELVENLPEKLDTEVAEDGANLSLGQRQLVCVGRALLKRSKILLLDEASSSIDMETDYLLQQTLRTEFADCTTITIAHRLATIMDSDRVLVLDAGRISEFDPPSVLLSRPDSLFYHLHQQTTASAATASASH